MRKAVRFFTVLINLAVILLCIIAGYYIFKLPDRYYVTEGTSLNIPARFDIETVREEPAQVLNTKVSPLCEQYTLKLFGLIPLKEVSVQPVDVPVLVPGGNPFGIKLLTDGVMVIGMGEVDGKNGMVCPARDSGIKMGDVITSIDGCEVTSNREIGKVISKCKGNPVRVKLIRDGEETEVNVTPVYSVSECGYKVGMWVRDSTAGIGTITFYDPATGTFGGLGHPVCDVDTGEILPLSSGEAVGVSVNGVNKGESGSPGELVGSFTSLNPIGSLDSNQKNGIYGKLDSAPNLFSPIPMAMRQEIQTGDATILTTVSGTAPKEYDIRIEKVELKDGESSKNMVIRITDPELLSLTGGIVQGMSGSPIIQNGKLVGAVTHVFVNDPTKGYGIFCDTMYDCSRKISADAA